MITVTVYRESSEYRGFVSSGHAEYAAEDEDDIICAAVSVLTVNAVNSIESFTDDAIAVRQDDGYLELILEGRISEKTQLLLDSMVLGLQGIQESYGEKYVKLIFEEV